MEPIHEYCLATDKKVHYHPSDCLLASQSCWPFGGTQLPTFFHHAAKVLHLLELVVILNVWKISSRNANDGKSICLLVEWKVTSDSLK